MLEVIADEYDSAEEPQGAQAIRRWGLQVAHAQDYANGRTLKERADGRGRFVKSSSDNDGCLTQHSHQIEVTLQLGGPQWTA